MRKRTIPLLPGFTYLGGKQRGYAVPEGFTPPPGINVKDGYISRRQYAKLIDKPLESSRGKGKPNDTYNTALNSYIKGKEVLGEYIPKTKKGNPNRQAIRTDPEFKALYKTLKNPNKKNLAAYAEYLKDPRIQAERSPDGILADILRKLGIKKDREYPVGETPK